MSAPLPEPGDRVRVTGLMPEDPDPIPVGTEGTVTNANPGTDRFPGQIAVEWDIPRSLMLLEGDPFEVWRLA